MSPVPASVCEEEDVERQKRCACRGHVRSYTKRREHKAELLLQVVVKLQHARWQQEGNWTPEYFGFGLTVRLPAALLDPSSTSIAIVQKHPCEPKKFLYRDACCEMREWRVGEKKQLWGQARIEKAVVARSKRLARHSRRLARELIVRVVGTWVGGGKIIQNEYNIVGGNRGLKTVSNADSSSNSTSRDAACQAR
ncbi:hypothetical protein FIBSPDRAFT_904468 [Athelia psychrophila]|uniref:Uncharacterized protein n=1 Tax=Athelia psychrophila TaxID=1759441 RepID=A0A167UQJ6_9AGAM|nr:hypothetical protein FIBSPDRAFT_904468 [Fibularhizoctonia sp. CBS 109695]